MAIVLDVGVIVILTVTCIVGYIRGFKRYFLGIVAAVVSTAAAAVGSDLLAEPVYDRYLRENVKSYVRSAIEGFDTEAIVMERLNDRELDGYVTDIEVGEALSKGGDYLENIGELLNSKGIETRRIEELRQDIDKVIGSGLPERIDRELAKSGFGGSVGQVKLSSEDIRECISRAAAQGGADAADRLTEKAIEPALTGVVRLLLFAVCYLLVMLLMQLIILISGIGGKRSEIKAADRFAGLALGAIKGLLYCAVIGWALSCLCSATRDSLSTFNAGIGDSTYLFRYFFDYFYK